MKIKMTAHFQGTGQPTLQKDEEYDVQVVGVKLSRWLVRHGKAYEVDLLDDVFDEEPKPSPKPSPDLTPKPVAKKVDKPIENVMQAPKTKRQAKKRKGKGGKK